MKKISKQAYTTEFKELAVKRVKDGEIVGKRSKIRKNLQHKICLMADEKSREPQY